jgi:hypothetical protein
VKLGCPRRVSTVHLLTALTIMAGCSRSRRMGPLIRAARFRLHLARNCPGPIGPNGAARAPRAARARRLCAPYGRGSRLP